MDFRTEYLYEWVHDEDYEKAELLWLWYDYYTEIYDRGLWSQYHSKNDETMVLLGSPEARKLSNQNAARIRQYIYSVARHFNISDRIMFDTKNDNYRYATKMQKRIDDFIELNNQGKFKFIYEVLGE